MLNRRCFITGLKGTILTKQELIFLKKYRPWGVILFSRNLHNIKQIKKLTSNIKKIFKDKNYPIIIDQEGGRVNRLKNIISLDRFTAEYFGKLFVKDKKEFSIIHKNSDSTSQSTLSKAIDSTIARCYHAAEMAREDVEIGLLGTYFSAGNNAQLKSSTRGRASEITLPKVTFSKTIDLDTRKRIYTGEPVKNFDLFFWESSLSK